jgi:hypothetical protein
MDLAQIQKDIASAEAAVNAIAGYLAPGVGAEIAVVETAANAAIALGTQLYNAVKGVAGETWTQVAAQTQSDLAAWEAALAAANAAP